MGETMDITKKLKRYIEESECKITIVGNKINVVNYSSIGHFDSNKIIIRYEEGSLIIKGESLVVTRLLHDEILITGNIKNIEIGSL